MRKSYRWLVCLAVAGLALAPSVGLADGAWLNGPVTQWNTAGQPLPQAPLMQGPGNPQCGSQERPPELYEDAQVVSAGWKLFGSYQGGWGVVVVQGTADYDGMCRPVTYQAFVFSDGHFAGTISPMPMASRTDGAGRVVGLSAPGEIVASFARYTPSDALCCPSSSVGASYEVSHTPNGPVLVLKQTYPMSGTTFQPPAAE